MMTATIRIEDVCIRIRHIHGDQSLKDRLSSLHDREIVILEIDRVSSAWRKMAQGKNDAPTPGLKPATDLVRNWWREQFESRKGETVTIREKIE
jgi:hypothetical protein